MNRLVQGDVGSGKTMVAAAAAYLRRQSTGVRQCPDGARRRSWRSSTTSICTALFDPSGGLHGPADRVPGRRRQAGGQGGHCRRFGPGGHRHPCAADRRRVRCHSLDLVIADEQHRFGVGQRAALSAKAGSPHLLVMSATPIPRTLSLILYGDLDLSVVDELPPGRQTIDTFLVGEAMRPRLNAFIRRQAEAGQSGLHRLPGGGGGRGGRPQVRRRSGPRPCSRSVFPDLTGGSAPRPHEGLAKRRPSWRGSAAGESQILVATTVIEVGVDVPNATLMVVENAERFGLSQLHQLRGRVGRGKEKSFCVLISDTPQHRNAAASQGPLSNQRRFSDCPAGPGFTRSRRLFRPAAARSAHVQGSQSHL